MLNSPQNRSSSRTPIARTILAAMLALVLLAGVAPFSSLSSHECGMACCVGRAPHEAGSCGAAAADAEEPADSHDAHHEQLIVRADAHHSSGHGADSSARQAHDAGPGPASSVARRAVTTPCSPECSAAATASAQLRRPRDSAAVSAAQGPRPPTRALFKRESYSPLYGSPASLRQTRGRAPPALLVNLSA